MSAAISECGNYRWSLERYIPELTPVCGAEPKTVMFVGVNPSTADAELDDPSVRKMKGFAKRWGYGRVVVGNLFAYRATKVRDLRGVAELRGSEFWDHFFRMVNEACFVVPCWGSRDKLPKELHPYADGMLKLLKESGVPLYHFGLTGSGDPKHPLMLPYETELTKLAEARNAARTTPPPTTEFIGRRKGALGVPTPPKK